MNKRFEITTPLAAAVATAFQEEIVDYMAYRGAIEISNTGANPTTAFSVQVQDHPDGEFYTILSGSDFGTLPDNDFLTFSSTNTPDALAAGAKAHLHINMNGLFAIRFQATSTLGTTIVIRGGFSMIARN